MTDENCACNCQMNIGNRCTAPCQKIRDQTGITPLPAVILDTLKGMSNIAVNGERMIPLKDIEQVLNCNVLKGIKDVDGT